MPKIEIIPLRGKQALEYIPALAKLRIEVFHEFPYLYDGSMDYEEQYLRTYTSSPDSLIVIAREEEAVVGASTAIPMRDETGEFQQPFLHSQFDINRIFYLGESVLLKAYRGQGIGVAFFSAREAHAQQVGGFGWYCFCAVERAADHPLRPAGYQTLDAFWNRRGYTKHPELYTYYTWKDIDQNTETQKKMVFWLKKVSQRGQ